MRSYIKKLLASLLSCFCLTLIIASPVSALPEEDTDKLRNIFPAGQKYKGYDHKQTQVLFA